MSREIKPQAMPPATNLVFSKLAGQKFISDYVLVGGTALSMQIEHRLSEDLDFVIDAEKINLNSIKRNISKLFPGYKIIRQDNGWQVDMIVDTVKLTFFSTSAVDIGFSVKNHAFHYGRVNICDAKTIASLKLAAIAQRNTIRDYYDLFMLAKYHYPLKDIIHQTKSLFPGLSPITYSETLIYTDDIEEENIAAHLSPVEIHSKNQIADYFTEELKKIKNEI